MCNAINVAVCMVAFGRSHVPSNASSWIAVAVDERPLEILDCIDSEQSLAKVLAIKPSFALC